MCTFAVGDGFRSGVSCGATSAVMFERCSHDDQFGESSRDSFWAIDVAELVEWARPEEIRRSRSPPAKALRGDGGLSAL